LATKILETFKQKVGTLELVPAGGGCFELTLDGELVYSKLKTGEFPDESEMIKLVGRRV
jgi:selenoprotein W-related protein